jgi:hypothetical protein
MAPLVRGLIIVVGLVLMIGGVAAIPAVGPAALWTVGMGAFLVVVPLIERQRYQSEAAEKALDTPGPGGGERHSEPLEPRFKPTTEVFVDPTTGHQMRVLVDPRTGERRYVAEG